MKIGQTVFPIVFLGLLFFVTGCDNSSARVDRKDPAIYSREQRLPTGARFANGGVVGVTLADIDGDGNLDIVFTTRNEVKFFENRGNGTFVDRGVIASTSAGFLDRGAGIAVGDIDGDGVLDIIIAAPNDIEVFKNPVPQKK